MAVDYFASGVFGYELTDADLDVMSRAMEEAAYLISEEGLDGDEADALVISKLPEGWVAGLDRRFHGTPGLTVLQFTGLDDDRPGRCNTPPGIWLYGVGMYAFGSGEPPLTAKFREGAEWHTWVSAG